MKNFKYITILFFYVSIANATSVKSKELSELVEESDHIFHVLITKVDMVDRNGKVIQDRSSRTGPGLSNIIRLHAKIVENGTLKTNMNASFDTIVVPLWQKWHYTLGAIQDSSINREEIFLLKGADYTAVYPRDFRREVCEKQKIVNLINKTPNKPQHNVASPLGLADARPCAER